MQILKNTYIEKFFERLLLTVRKYTVNNILQVLYEQPATDIHNTSMKIESSFQIPEKNIWNEVVDVGSLQGHFELDNQRERSYEFTVVR